MLQHTMEAGARMQAYTFIAHTRDDGAVQPLLEHLRATALLARAHAEPWGGGSFAYMCGLAHDIGKYSEAFQKRIRGSKTRVDHATAGGQFLMEALGGSKLGILAAYCAMGHHGGLPNGGSSSQDTDKHCDGYKATIFSRLKWTIEDYQSFIGELGSLPRLDGFSHNRQWKDGFDAAFFVRMAFSALVDADWLDTEQFFNHGNAPRGGFLSMPELRERLAGHTARLLDDAAGDATVLKRLRNQLLRDCLDAARRPPGLFTLTAPTGSGKTIASLAFALEHAARGGMQRVIYVVPYNTIIEQNAAVFEGLLGAENVLRHYGDAPYDGDDAASVKKRHSIENWDYPLIMSSSVQFFESLFSNKPSRCRKLHNIAGSVLIFDEAQMIPVPYLDPCVRAIETLVTQYGCSAVLATATQSSLDSYFKRLQLTEIAQNPIAMDSALRRATIRQIDESLDDATLAERLLAHKQVLCVVNTRRHAQELFALLSDAALDGAFHLSTTMYHAHRKRALDVIRERLEAGQACRVVSTSLVEAGVDLDFGTVYREQAGLDSVVQAAGRCNREGRHAPEDSIVHVFVSADHKPPRMLARNIAACGQVARKYADLASLEAISAYFCQLFYLAGPDGKDTKRIVPLFNDGKKETSFPFANVAASFNLIDDSAQRVVYALHEAPALEGRVRSGERSRGLFREMGAYSVTLYEQDIRALDEIGAIDRLDKADAIDQPDKADASILLLARHQYDGQTGVSLSPEGGQALFV